MKKTEVLTSTVTRRRSGQPSKRESECMAADAWCCHTLAFRKLSCTTSRIPLPPSIELKANIFLPWNDSSKHREAVLISRTILPSYVVIPHEDITQYYFICCQSATFSFESKIHLRRHSDYNIRFINVYQYALRSFATSDRRLANLRVPAVQANFVRPFVLVDAFEHLHLHALCWQTRSDRPRSPLVIVFELTIV